MHPELPMVTALPFLLLLLCIAVLPLAAPHFWESNRNKLVLSLLLSAPVAAYLLLTTGPEPLTHAILEYVQFIALLATLYVISGGIVVTGDIEASPRNNAYFMALGGILASFIGTTGASMLLIRPLLSTNSQRKHVVHTVVFFIFIVGNCGGCLTPLGDPPLFIGYLRGVPFLWTFDLWPEWLGTMLILVGMYTALDKRIRRSEPAYMQMLDQARIEPIRVRGLINLFLMTGVILCVAFVPSIDLEKGQFAPFRELAMIALCIMSFAATPESLRAENQFSFHSINEVAALFLGIFVTMVPALLILASRGAQLGVDTPAEFFWYTGGLSSFLDNAPTYATFLELGRSVTLSGNLAPAVAGVYEPFLKAISLGAVFMGANTYIGNGPNFMIKSIAESRGVKMPSFFGYMAYSGAILLPLFVLLTVLIFR